MSRQTVKDRLINLLNGNRKEDLVLIQFRDDKPLNNINDDRRIIVFVDFAKENEKAQSETHCKEQ